LPVEPEAAMPVAAPLAAGLPPQAGTAKAAALPGKKRWQFGAAAAALLLTAGLGLYALAHNTADDTIMLALPQTMATPTRAAAPAQAKGLAPSESQVAVPPLVTLPKASVPATPVAPAAVADVAPPAVEAKPAAPVVEMVSYKLAIKPWGTVYVDGRERGVSPPMKRLALPAGKHKIRIVNPSFPDYSINLESGKNKSGTIEHDFASAKK
jgi:hypothetical protein